MSPFRKMQLAVFAVVLILPALQSGGCLSGVLLYDCMDILEDAGDIKCELEGYGPFKDYDPELCTLKCSKPGTPKLPNGVCTPGDGVICTSGAREGLWNWRQGLQKALNNVLTRWCKYNPAK
uniref:Putative ixodes 10 kDa peptide protein n=1 Tax=Ixodes ricinus TaxID=34613 RepID=A0A0K8RJY7_IXORI